MARIDAIAREAIADSERAAERAKAVDRKDDPDAWRRWRMRAVSQPMLVIHRTLADPAYLDLSIDPDERPLGSLFAFPDPFDANYARLGLARTMTPRGWLSTWSGHASRASTLDCLPKLTLPTLVVAYLGDNAVFSNHTDAIYERSPARDKTIRRVRGDHLGLGPAGMSDRSGQNAALDVIVPWIQERFS